MYQRLIILAIVTTAITQTGCAGPMVNSDEEREWHSRGLSESAGFVVNLEEPTTDEVVIVINSNPGSNNSGFGTHAGMFVVSRLSDPAGNYVATRARDHDWKGPTLRDYVKWHLQDGYLIQIFRFKLETRDFRIIDARVANFVISRPGDCATDVLNQIAGVGPFRALKPAGWLSPSGLARSLLPLIEGPVDAGICVWPSGRPCLPDGVKYHAGH